ncbi:hypothetical protein [Microbacterium sp. RURRCA19A]|uniref:hypothetical protein n=1 Tax=Microbacterium sp. RURRCA19A TaxID=1907391 RepID=UPI000954783D|nr:hypothetical protein [Microbacterium sp. RURRCA19A]SIR46227.1 hypothetical protein SAMN05880568_0066 [Microbacterium sp. RURRCA19A]
MSAAITIPDPPAEPQRLRENAARLRTTSERYEFLVTRALFAWSLLPEGYRAPEADLLHTALATTHPAAEEIADGLAAAGRALEQFADEIDDLAHRGALLSDRWDAGPPTDLWDESVGGPATELNERRRDEWASGLSREAAGLDEAYDDASRRCAHALRAIPDVAWASLAAWSGPERPEPVRSLSDAAGLALLERLASGPDPARLLADHPEWAGIIRGTDPAQVAEWWSRLDRRAAGALVTHAPGLVGNLDGVAITDRIEANRGRASEYLRELRTRRQALEALRAPRSRANALEVLDRRAERARLDREIAYFDAVANGTTQLYAWDPAHGSLIEMAGDPSTAKAALFVVPGTNTDAEAFMSEQPLTRFADWQVKSGGGSVLAFTVMTGPMPQIDLDILKTGPQWNLMAEDCGWAYGRFVQGMNAVRPDLWTMSYEHSYGGAVGSEAEKHGGVVDTRFLAASVGAIGPYEPHPDTTYFAAQAPDDINRYYAGVGFGPVGFSVAPESFPGVHVVNTGIPGFDPFAVTATAVTGQPFYLPRIIDQSIDHHSALMSDDESINGKVLNQVKQTLALGGGTE